MTTSLKIPDFTLKPFGQFKNQLSPHLKSFTVNIEGALFFLCIYGSALSWVEQQQLRQREGIKVESIRKSRERFMVARSKLKKAITLIKEANDTCADLDILAELHLDKTQTILQIIEEYVDWQEKEELPGMIHPDLRTTYEAKTTHNLPYFTLPYCLGLGSAEVDYWFIERLDRILSAFVIRANGTPLIGADRNRLISKVFTTALGVRYTEDGVKTARSRIAKRRIKAKK